MILEGIEQLGRAMHLPISRPKPYQRFEPVDGTRPQTDGSGVTSQSWLRRQNVVR
jgi:hypothetical protein